MINKQFFCLLAAGALNAGATVPNIDDLGEFGRAAAQALDEVGRFREDFALAWWKPPYNQSFFDDVKCERAQEFHIVADETEQAYFAMGACKAEATRIRDFAVATEKATKETVDYISANADRKPNSREREKLDSLVAFRKVRVAGGATGYSFTLVQGMLGFIRGAVVHDPARQVAYIVMADVSQLCGYSAPEGRSPKPSPFCPDTGKALLDVATALARRDARSSP